MFDKSTAQQQRKRAIIRLTLVGKQTVEGEVTFTADRGLAGLLNDPAPFLEISMGNKAGRLISKSSIIDAEVLVNRSAEETNPYKILKIQNGASLQEVREAWKKRLKAVHPDRLSGLDLDEEILYAAQKASLRINAAYDVLCESFRKKFKERAAQQKQSGTPSEPGFSVYY